jgi:SOS response associated peptidase (SRAP)
VGLVRKLVWRVKLVAELRLGVMTEDANAQMSTLHSRMPVILEQADWPLWLSEADAGAEMLLRSAPEGILRISPVDKRVGNVRDDGPELLEPHVLPEPLRRPPLQSLEGRAVFGDGRRSTPFGPQIRTGPSCWMSTR